MKVRELIELLSAMPGDLDVVVKGYEAGFDDIGVARQGHLRRDVNSPEDWYFGPHEEADTADEATVGAVFIEKLEKGSTVDSPAPPVDA